MAEAPVKITIRGEAELGAAFRKYERKVRYQLAKDLLVAAKLVSDDARERLTPFSRKSAMGIRPRVRRGGVVVVEQRREKTTGYHPEFGALQMRRALLPALRDKEQAVIDAVEHVLAESARQAGL